MAIVYLLVLTVAKFLKAFYSKNYTSQHLNACGNVAILGHFIFTFLFKGAGLVLRVGNRIVTSLFWCVLLSLAHRVSIHKSNKTVKRIAKIESIFSFVQ